MRRVRPPTDLLCKRRGAFKQRYILTENGTVLMSESPWRRKAERRGPGFVCNFWVGSRQNTQSGKAVVERCDVSEVSH